VSVSCAGIGIEFLSVVLRVVFTGDGDGDGSDCARWTLKFANTGVIGAGTITPVTWLGGGGVGAVLDATAAARVPIPGVSLVSCAMGRTREGGVPAATAERGGSLKRDFFPLT